MRLRRFCHQGSSLPTIITVGGWGGRCLRADPRVSSGLWIDPDPGFGGADWGCHSSGCPLRFPVCPFWDFLEQGEDFVMAKSAAALGDGMKEIWVFASLK